MRNLSPTWLVIGALLCVHAATASAQAPACSPPQKPMLDIELLLGRGTASDARWRQFLAREVTPRFPDGLTVYETYGQWRDPKRNVIVREKSRVMRIIVAADAPARTRSRRWPRPTRSSSARNRSGSSTRTACVSF